MKSKEELEAIINSDDSTKGQVKEAQAQLDALNAAPTSTGAIKITNVQSSAAFQKEMEASRLRIIPATCKLSLKDGMMYGSLERIGVDSSDLTKVIRANISDMAATQIAWPNTQLFRKIADGSVPTTKEDFADGVVLNEEIPWSITEGKLTPVVA
jgi:hypothetical protein